MERKDKERKGRIKNGKEGSIRAPLIVWNGIINSWFRKGFHVSPLYTGERERSFPTFKA